MSPTQGSTPRSSSPPAGSDSSAARPAQQTCKRCGAGTVFKTNICRWCQTADEKSTKASEQ